MRSSLIVAARMRFITALAMLGLMSCGSQSGVIQPGMWETTVTMAAGNAELWRSAGERCIYEEEAGNPGTGFLRVGPLNHCTVSRSQFGDGRFVVEASCPERQSIQASVPMTPEWLASRISVQGTYTRTSMEGALEAELEDTLDPMHFNGRLTARRTGDC